MRYLEYAELFAPVLTFADHSPAGRAAAARAMLSSDLIALTMPGPGSRATRTAELQAAGNREFEVLTHAVRDAAPELGGFPVVIYSPGMSGPSFENDILVEYLASQGYIVLATPSVFNVAAKQAWPLPDAVWLESQARDIEYLIGYGRKLPGASRGAVGSIGFSWGGEANVVVAARNNALGAIVCLDGSIRYFFSRPYVQSALTTGLPYTTPSLFLNQGANTSAAFFTTAGADSGHAFFDSVRYADAYRVTMKRIDHQNFVAWYNRFAGRQPVNFVSDTAISNRSYEDVARYTLNFLNAYLKRDSAGMAFLQKDPTALGMSPSDVAIVRKRALRPLPTISSFAHEARAVGLAHAPELLGRVRESDPAYTIPESDLSDLGWRLDGAEAIAIFQVRTALYPKSAIAQSDLGDAYLAHADTALAIQMFERALQLDSTKTYARNMLRRLRKQ